MITINLKKTGTLGGSKPLLAGTHTYKVTGAALALNKQDPRGKEHYIAIDLTSEEGGSHRVNLNVMSSNDVQQRIAMETIGSFAKAIGFKGDNFKIPDHLKMLVNKLFVITTRQTQGKGENKDKTYVNISDIEPANCESEDEPEVADEEEVEEVEEVEETETEEEVEESTTPKRPWG